MSTSSRLLPAALPAVLLCLASTASAAAPSFSFSGNQMLTIKTDRYEIEWRDGCMVSLTTLLPRRMKLTADGAPMDVGLLPNGVGSFHDHETEGREQHHPWGTFPLATTFPAQHPPCRNSRVSFERTRTGARLTYLGLKGDDDGLPAQENINDVIGAIPVWTTGVDDRVAEAKVMPEKARLWAEGFRPYFPEEWEPAAVSYMRNPGGAVVKYVRRGGATYCYEETPKGSRLRYARVTGANRIASSSPVKIDGWIGYDAKGPGTAARPRSISATTSAYGATRA